MSINEIVLDIVKNIQKEDIYYFSTYPLDEHDTYMRRDLGTWIRNTYGLWKDSPLTERWRTDESSRDIFEGTDYSKDRPDQVSADIIVALWNYLNSKEYHER